MTVLAAEPNIYPDDLFARFSVGDATVEQGSANACAGAPTGGDSPAHADWLTAEGSDRTWWVLRTKARQEKAIARELSQKRVPFYLPLLTERRLIRGRPAHVHLPMFAGYVFVFGSDDERVVSLKTNRVAQVLPVVDQRRFMRDLWQVDKLASSGAELSLESGLSVGRRVRVVSGSLLGLEGVVISRRGINRLFVSVDLIQQGVSLEVDDFMVEPLD